ncbi:hypothetical protein HK103_002998 [Boothiomyces macroporosus]|uniref:Malate dehydrogenase n=1 Tax=Boothiomyces macroporosus TaxID=261099 RepID=A0AAD5UIH9_9FUNG|nr:hypothetical protein HK103_002998 [Boothiomyces macroporosus]
MYPILLAALASAAPSYHLSYSSSLFDGVPSSLIPPAGTKLMAKYFGSGTQNYVCSGGAWTLDSADAILAPNSESLKNPEVSHYFVNGKPTWRYLNDESVVTGAAVNKATVGKDDIVWILLARNNALSSDSGKFSNVVNIMRVYTKGGLPTGNCTTNQSVRVAYNADYWFFTN